MNYNWIFYVLPKNEWNIFLIYLYEKFFLEFRFIEHEIQILNLQNNLPVKDNNRNFQQIIIISK